jgi:hypothetical protein
MEDERRRRQVLHRQATELVYKIFSYFKRETDAGMPVHDVAKAQERTAEVCDTSTRIVQRIISEGSVAVFSLSFSPCTPPVFVRVGNFSRSGSIFLETTCHSNKPTNVTDFEFVGQNCNVLRCCHVCNC